MSRIVSLKNGSDSELVHIAFSDGSKLSLRSAYLGASFKNIPLSIGDEIKDDFAERLVFAASCYRAEQAALRLSARAEQCVFGLKGKLEKRGHDAECIREVVERLCSLGLVDDRRFAALWLDSRISVSAESPLRLRVKLCRRGIAPKIAESALKKRLSFEAELLLLEKFLVKTALIPQAGASGGLDLVRRKLRFEGFSAAVLSAFFEKNFAKV